VRSRERKKKGREVERGREVEQTIDKEKRRK
jgi:hypothetical protein